MAEQLDLKLIETKDATGLKNGWMIPIYKKNDPYFADYDMRFVYASSVAAGSCKGPHMHKKRECRLVCIKGSVDLVVRENGEYKKYVLSASNPIVVTIKAGNPFMVKCNESTYQEGILLNFANHIWSPDDQDNYKPDEWDYKE